MKIAFVSTEIESLCKQAKLATKQLGALSAKKLQLRLSELFNAEHVGELVTGRPHPLQGNKHGYFAVDLYGGDRLVFKPTQTPPPAKPDGGIDWHKVTAITIVELGDYHD
jgi:proteic killer suppression protein